MLKLCQGKGRRVPDERTGCAAIERAWAEDAAGETIPGEVVKAILNGESPLRVWRKHREFTLDALAERVGVSKEYLSLPDERTALGKKTRKWQLSGAQEMAILESLQKCTKSVRPVRRKVDRI